MPIASALSASVASFPLVSEYPLELPGYYYQELTSERFVLLCGQLHRSARSA
jgi:hypothetical protein